MDRQELDAIRRRLHTMERRWCLTLACVIGVVVVALPSQRAASQPTTLHAQRIEIADNAGRIRILLGVEPDGEAAISLRDPMGQPRIDIGVASNGWPTVLLRSGHHARLLLTVDSGGTPMVMLADDAGQPRINLQITPAGGQGLWFYSPKQGEPTMELVANPKGISTLAFSDAGTPRIGLILEAGGGASLALFDVSGQPLFRAP